MNGKEDLRRVAWGPVGLVFRMGWRGWGSGQGLANSLILDLKGG